MKANSKIITKWLEQIMAKKIIFHFKAIRDYRVHALQPTESDNNMLLLLLDSWTRKAAEDYINSIEKIIRESHKFLDVTAETLETNDIYSKSTKVEVMAQTMSKFYEKIESDVLTKCDSTVVREITSGVTFSEIRNRLNIPSVIISLTKEDNDDDSSNSESFSIIGRQFGVQKIYEANKSAIVGHDLQNLLKKTEKQLKLSLKQINRDNSRTRHNVKKAVDKIHQSLITCMSQIEKNSYQDLEANRYRAEMYVSYKVDQDLKVGKPKKNIQKYLKELSARTRIHAEKIKYVLKLLIKFFDSTNQEYSLFMKESISDFDSIQTHKVNACKCILRASQREFAYMAEIAHAQLLNQVRELEMKDALTYAIGEFVKGMKWVDHHFMKALIDSSRESLQALLQFSLTGKDFSLKVKSTDIQEAIEVINLYFVGFLKSHMTPDENDDNLIERLQNISSSSSSDDEDSSDDNQDPGEEISKENGNHEMNKLSVTAASNSKKMLIGNANEIPMVKQSSSTPGLGYNGNNSSTPIMGNITEFNPEIFLQDKI
ncbi:unnamed protein product [Allacma fusca]|uniref:Uncharacterized protein n=2 Tax=Allacma fusca TaxID=39272 RepID=A0A8J2PV39_9HEXA|nr:unnamed protein product [Allacma fusca]